jgi:hypothetical protein
LCPTDFSATAMKAMKYAEQLALEFDSQLTVMPIPGPRFM